MQSHTANIVKYTQRKVPAHLTNFIFPKDSPRERLRQVKSQCETS